MAPTRIMPSTAATRLERIRSAIDLYQGRLIRFAARITGDIESGRDVVQDTFLRLCGQDLDEVDDHLPAWLFRVCRNRALDVKKKEGPLHRLDDAARHSTSDPAPGADDALERSEDVARILAALGELSPAQQEVIRLRFQEELSYKEISAVTTHTVGSVGVLIHTGVKALRARLGRAENPRPLPAEGGRRHA